MIILWRVECFYYSFVIELCNYRVSRYNCLLYTCIDQQRTSHYITNKDNALKEETRKWQNFILTHSFWFKFHWIELSKTLLIIHVVQETLLIFHIVLKYVLYTIHIVLRNLHYTRKITHNLALLVGWLLTCTISELFLWLVNVFLIFTTIYFVLKFLLISLIRIICIMAHQMWNK